MRCHEIERELERVARQQATVIFAEIDRCGGPLRRRTSWQKHLLLRVVNLRCDNDDCGASFTAHEEIVYRLSPPSSPNPDIHLPTKAEHMAGTV
jgi:hypothetical protein